MNLEELQQELRRLRAPSEAPPSGALPLSPEEALARRDAGNLPDGSGRTLRLVLHVSDPPEPGALERKRLLFEPDYHRAPTWRRPGSVPVNVVPLRLSRDHPAHFDAWYEDPAVAALEAEWQATGAVCGISIPSDMRAFVFKTVLALRSAGAEVSVESVAGSVARWLRPADAERVRTALRSANQRSTGA